MKYTAAQLAALAHILAPYRDQPLTRAALDLALRLAAKEAI